MPRRRGSSPRGPCSPSRSQPSWCERPCARLRRAQAASAQRAVAKQARAASDRAAGEGTARHGAEPHWGAQETLRAIDDSASQRQPLPRLTSKGVFGLLVGVGSACCRSRAALHGAQRRQRGMPRQRSSSGKGLRKLTARSSENATGLRQRPPGPPEHRRMQRGIRRILADASHMQGQDRSRPPYTSSPATASAPASSAAGS